MVDFSTETLKDRRIWTDSSEAYDEITAQEDYLSCKYKLKQVVPLT